MATKKTHTSGKTVKITKTQILLQRNKRLHIALAVFAVVFIAIAGYAGVRAVKLNTNKARLNEIVAIYDSLKLDESYRMNQANVFGDKRVYEWDKGRTYASEIQYGHDAKPADTRADLREKILASGFTFVQTEYEGSIQPIDEYRNDKGNYVRIGVMSQYSRNAFEYGNFSESDPLINHKDESPSYVSIKVNLDDNNE